MASTGRHSCPKLHPLASGETVLVTRWSWTVGMNCQMMVVVDVNEDGAPAVVWKLMVATRKPVETLNEEMPR